MSAKEGPTGSLAQRTFWGAIRGAQRVRYVLWCIPLRPRHVWQSLRLLGAYRQRGWFTCVSRRASVDRHGRALPWLTYPTIDWLDSVLSPEDRVFEFGMGGSTLWMAERVKSVTSVDENPDWVARFKPPPNVTISVAIPRGDSRYAEEGDPYVAAIQAAGPPFDVVLVDGHSRLSCAEAAHRALADDGLIIFDNSDKPMYAPALKMLGDLGYMRIDFAGTKPNENLLCCTSVYSRAMDKWLRRARAKAPRYWGRSISEFSGR
jgi:hypothetical protein